MELIGAIDQGTSSTRLIIFKAGTCEVLVEHQLEVQQHFPNEGWVEQDPLELLKSVHLCIQGVVDKLQAKNIPVSSIKGIGLTNQRETTIVWNRLTGIPVHPAMVWSDARNSLIVKNLCSEFGQDHLRTQCGLPIATYFSATKLLWLWDHIPEVKQLAEEGNLLFGTVDTWILWNLTGGTQNGLHLTDVTNASRTMLMSLKTLSWDPSLLKFFNLPLHILPTIKASSDDFGCIATGPMRGIKISGVVGDQQAALLGQGCTRIGEAKSTYGTGCFMLYNTGDSIVESKHGLLTTVAYQQAGRSATYALEGSVAVAGSSVRWLRDNLGLIKDSSEISSLAEQVEKTDGVYFVPAFSGLFAPHWKSDARGTLCGLTSHSTKHHICRAVLEATCFQVKDIFEAMKMDSKSSPSSILVDGGMTASQILLQLQSNILGIDVQKPSFSEVTALGAAVAAGVSLGLWQLGTKISDLQTYSPEIDNIYQSLF
ncbi:glycerol kinase isoform X2 [Eurytemora carolleeae]|uniref:glycerol kinase isoform X2 n=1 Tax=Eurytemora carolleeae TaxID=1294199 RepID=UPI000C75F9D7|nr:glycerol kinase isoform X2 [Eurytemora carolleeae]|eukprot:XP_023344174.1 glycerol kinase-like isoform X2 [Eurytemora affinis]